MERLDLLRLRRPAALIYNASAGQKLGFSTNESGPAEVKRALIGAGIEYRALPTEYAGHATELARQAVKDGHELVIAAGGDGTVNEVAHGLADTTTVLGIMPLGSIMNVARTLHIPRSLPQAAVTIASGQVLRMDLGRVGDDYFLEAAGAGLDAALFAYFERLDRGARPERVIRAVIRFLRDIGNPRLRLELPGFRREVRAPMVTVSNGPFVGAAYALAPHARIDDGELDVMVFRGATVPSVLLHLLRVAGGRRLPLPPNVESYRVPWVAISTRGRKQLAVHADGSIVGATPCRFVAVPGALRVLVGTPAAGEPCAWEPER